MTVLPLVNIAEMQWKQPPGFILLNLVSLSVHAVRVVHRTEPDPAKLQEANMTTTKTGCAAWWCATGPAWPIWPKLAADAFPDAHLLAGLVGNVVIGRCRNLTPVSSLDSRHADEPLCREQAIAEMRGRVVPGHRQSSSSLRAPRHPLCAPERR